MLFNEKLYKLRKEKGLSQEDLAQELNTTRQAVSKWENNQSYPETEKLLMISNLFDVSVDYLLKDTNENNEARNKHYYASEEMIEGYFSNRKSSFCTFSIGGFIFILGIGAYFKFTHENFSPIIMIMLLVLGGIVMILGVLKCNKNFDILEKKPLIFDKNFQTEINEKYKKEITKLSIIFGVSFVIFLIFIFPIRNDLEPLTKDFTNGIPLYFKIIFISIAISTPIMFYSGSVLNTYLLVVDNEKYTNSFSFKLSRKLKTKLHTWLE